MLTSFDTGISVYIDRVKSSYKTLFLIRVQANFNIYIYSPSVKDYRRKFKANP